MSSLYRVGHLRRWAVRNQAELADVKTEIDARRPLCARVAWSQGAHFVAIVGYYTSSAALAGSDMISIEDSWSGPSDVPFDEFCTSYLGDRVWTDTYYTKA